MNDTVKELLLQALPSQAQAMSGFRWALTTVGALLGYYGATDINSEAGLYATLAGVATALFPLVWGVADKTIRAQLAKTAQVPGVTVVVHADAPDAAKAVAFDPTVPNVVQRSATQR